VRPGTSVREAQVRRTNTVVRPLLTKASSGKCLRDYRSFSFAHQRQVKRCGGSPANGIVTAARLMRRSLRSIVLNCRSSVWKKALGIGSGRADCCMAVDLEWEEDRQISACRPSGAIDSLRRATVGFYLSINPRTKWGIPEVCLEKVRSVGARPLPTEWSGVPGPSVIGQMSGVALGVALGGERRQPRVVKVNVRVLPGTWRSRRRQRSRFFRRRSASCRSAARSRGGWRAPHGRKTKGRFRRRRPGRCARYDARKSREDWGCRS
jgi:hypothetical protein